MITADIFCINDGNQMVSFLPESIILIKYWLKIIKSKSYRFIKVLFKVQLSTINTDGTRVNWVSKVRD